MSEWKSRVTTHLRSAQDWLSKAQRSFDEQKDIRGELNLMLAQAELKRAQEEKRSAKRRLRYACYRQGGAILCAIILFGLGSLIWTARSVGDADQTVTHMQTTATRSTHSLTTESIPVSGALAVAETSSAAKAREDSEEHLMSVSVKAPYEEYNEAHQAASAAVLSKEEMQDLIKAAGRSLRGQ